VAAIRHHRFFIGHDEAPLHVEDLVVVPPVNSQPQRIDKRREHRPDQSSLACIPSGWPKRHPG